MQTFLEMLAFAYQNSSQAITWSRRSLQFCLAH